MLNTLHKQKTTQLLLGFFIGIGFGFLLQKGGATYYDVIIGQLLLTDFTVLKIMLSAMITGMVGVHLLVTFNLAQLHPKPGAWGATIPGALIFGVGFGILGYCPGTVVGAVGHGALDALFGGVPGILLGAAAFAALYPRLMPFLKRGDFGNVTFPRLFGINPWFIVVPVVLVVLALFYVLESAGL